MAFGGPGRVPDGIGAPLGRRYLHVYLSGITKLVVVIGTVDPGDNSCLRCSRPPRSCTTAVTDEAPGHSAAVGSRVALFRHRRFTLRLTTVFRRMSQGDPQAYPQPVCVHCAQREVCVVSRARYVSASGVSASGAAASAVLRPGAPGRPPHRRCCGDHPDSACCLIRLVSSVTWL